MLKLTSLADNYTLGAEVSHLSSASKIIPGETHNVKFPAAQNASASASKREYYYEMPNLKFVNTITLEMTYPVLPKLTVILYLKRKDTKELVHIPIIANESGGFYYVKQRVELRVGVYYLTITNDHPEVEAKALFRLNLNGMLEMEENGFRQTTLNKSSTEQIQLMITQPGYLNLTLLTCKSKVDVFLVQGKYKKEVAKEDLILSAQEEDLSGQPLSYQAYIWTKGPVYLTVANQKNQPAEYALISSVKPVTSSQSADEDVSVLPLVLSFADVESSQIGVKIPLPIMDFDSLEKKYPDAHVYTLQFTLHMLIEEEANLPQASKLFESLKYCSSGASDPRLFNSTLYLSFLRQTFKDLPQFIRLPIDISPSMIQQMFRNGVTHQGGLFAVSSAKVTLHIYEKDNPEPVGLVVKLMGTTRMPVTEVTSELMKKELRQPFIQTVVGKVLMIFATLLAMILVLVVVYFCAARLAGEYKQLSANEAGSGQTPTSFEMSQTYEKAAVDTKEDQ